MFRLWAKIIFSGKIVKNMTIENSDSSLNRTKKIFNAIDEVCYTYDLSKPLWLDKNINEFKKNFSAELANNIIAWDDLAFPEKSIAI